MRCCVVRNLLSETLTNTRLSGVGKAVGTDLSFEFSKKTLVFLIAIEVFSQT